MQEQPGEGYRVVLVALLSRFNLEVQHNEEALKYLVEYKELNTNIPGNLSDHPEIIASRAFAIAFCNSTSSGEVIKLYGAALEEKEDVDWLYGQCLAIEKELRLPGKDDDLQKKPLKRLRNTYPRPKK